MSLFQAKNPTFSKILSHFQVLIGWQVCVTETENHPLQEMAMWLILIMHKMSIIFLIRANQSGQPYNILQTSAEAQLQCDGTCYESFAQTLITA